MIREDRRDGVVDHGAEDGDWRAGGEAAEEAGVGNVGEARREMSGRARVYPEKYAVRATARTESVVAAVGAQEGILKVMALSEIEEFEAQRESEEAERGNMLVIPAGTLQIVSDGGGDARDEQEDGEWREFVPAGDRGKGDCCGGEDVELDAWTTSCGRR